MTKSDSRRRRGPACAISAETVAAIRDAYAGGTSLAHIYRDHDVNKDAVYYWVDGGPIKDGRPALPPLPRRRPRGAGTPEARAVKRDAVIARVWRAAAAQARKVERRIVTEPEARETDSRALAVLVKTLRELVAYDTKQGGEPAAADTDFPRDMDEFRRDLARRLEAIAAEAEAEGAEETHAAPGDDLERGLGILPPQAPGAAGEHE